MKTLASYIDHTLLKPTCTHIEIEKICKEALDYGFAAVCVPPTFVVAAGALLCSGEGSGALLGRNEVSGARVKVATVIGFPFGYSVVDAKLTEVVRALLDGADELDVVINLTALKGGKWNDLREEMQALIPAVHLAGKIIKVIIETGVLTDEEIIRCCEIYAPLEVDFLKTSTGYAGQGATVAAVRLMRAHLPAAVRIKASGGIRDLRFARELIAAGADRLGASAGVSIVREDAALKGEADFY